MKYENNPEERKAMLAGVGRLFGIDDTIADTARFSSGHINDTFFVRYENGRKLVFQAINTYVFKKPEEVMENIISVTGHLKAKYIEQGLDPSRRVLNFISTTSGKYCTEDDNGFCWRAYDYIDNSETYDTVSDPALILAAGTAFGEFQKQLMDFPLDGLHETISDFHNTPKRFSMLREAVALDPCGRVSDVMKELDFFDAHEKYACCLIDEHASGRLPLRVTHNDTKFNNVLIDKATSSPLCIIDLDTVMPGFSVIDYGDAIRFAAASSAEDEKELSKVFIDPVRFEAFTRGFIGSGAGFFTKAETDGMIMGAIVVTLELAVRFFTDYILGDKYFRICREEQNLDRARAQMKLVADMENRFDELDKIVKRFI